MELPHAAEIRRVRTLVERSHRARADLTDVEPALTILSLGSGADRAEALLERLRQSWDDFELEGEAHAALSKARLQLYAAVREGEQVQSLLHRLQHQQWEELNKEEWREAREELNQLNLERVGVAGTLQPLHQLILSLDPIGPALTSQLQMARADQEEGNEIRASARLEACHAALVDAFARNQLDIELPTTEEAGNLADAVEEGVNRARELADKVRGERDRLQGLLADIEARIQARTG